MSVYVQGEVYRFDPRKANVSPCDRSELAAAPAELAEDLLGRRRSQPRRPRIDHREGLIQGPDASRGLHTELFADRSAEESHVLDRGALGAEPGRRLDEVRPGRRGD